MRAQVLIPLGLTAAIALLSASMALPSAAQTPAPSTSSDPNAAGLESVCGACHSTDIIKAKTLSWNQWIGVFTSMAGEGATGSDEELNQVLAYIRENLTSFNVNTATADDMTWVLQSDPAVGEAIVKQRATKPFKTLDDLKAVPGIDKARVDKLKARIQFS